MIWAQTAYAINQKQTSQTTVSCNQGNHSLVKTTKPVIYSAYSEMKRELYRALPEMEHVLEWAMHVYKQNSIRLSLEWGMSKHNTTGLSLKWCMSKGISTKLSLK